MKTKRAFIVVGLLVLSTVSWRHGAYYQGGFDTVVVLKALIGCLALGLALLASDKSGPFRPTSAVLLTVYLVLSLIGALPTNGLLASSVLAARILLVAITVEVLWRSLGTARLLKTVINVSIMLVLVAGGTGLAVWKPGQRLAGGAPPITPNELAFFASVTVIYLFWRLMSERFQPVRILLLILFVAVIWMTESRTSLASTFVAVTIIAITTKRPHPVFVALVCLFSPLFYYVLSFTDILTAYIQRGGAEHLGTFSNRTLAWQSAFSNAPTTWATFFGQGLSVKEVGVTARYWDTQPLDSSWASAIVQAGWTGAIVLAIWVLLTAICLRHLSPPLRGIALGLLVYLVSRSILESGLFDATAAFMIFYTISLACRRPSAINPQYKDSNMLTTLTPRIKPRSGPSKSAYQGE